MKIKSFFSATCLVLFISLILSISFCHTSFSEEEYANKIIKYVSVKNNKTISEAKILSKLKTKKGELFLEKVVNEDVKRLYLLGFFSDVEVSIEEVYDGIGIVFIVTEKSPLSSITFKGNKVYNAQKLLAVVKSKSSELVDEKKLRKDSEAIEDLYKRAGYPWITVHHELKSINEQGEGEVVFVIDEGPKAVVRGISILDNVAFSDKRILKIIKSRTSGFFRSGVYKQDVIEDDMERIKAFYRNEGFLDVESNYELLSHEKRSKKWIELVMRIDEGKQYITGETKITGNSIFSQEELKSLLKLRRDDVFTESALHKEVTTLQENYFDKGYIMAKVKPDTVLNIETDKVDVIYNIFEGEVCYVNKVNIQGNTKTKDIVVRRELRLNPGDRYDGNKLRKSKERLYNLGFFEDIAFNIDDTETSNKKDMEIEVKESKTGEFSFGGGFSSIDKLIGFIEIEQKNFDLFNFPTFTGDGQDLKLRAELGSVRKNYLLSWTEPWIFDHPVSFGFDLYATERSRSGSTGYAYDEAKEGVTLRLAKWFNDFLRGDLSYRLESVDISDLSVDASQSLKDEAGKNTISSVFMQLTRDTRDNRFNPSKGLLVSGAFEVAGGAIGGDKDFAKFSDSISRYSTIGPFVLELKGRSGVVTSFGDSTTVPIYERFFAGGTYTVRGYKERDIGPKDVSGDPVGGGTMVVGNAELTMSIIENLKGAIFLDAGNVWATPDSKPKEGMLTRGIKVGTGVGVRIKTPIGPVKLDYGFPMNPDDNQEDTGRFHFSMSRGF
ncbi:MAG: outer membrane protein assembly factor BamA [Candidatus Omnitrophota bacterium]